MAFTDKDFEKALKDKNTTQKILNDLPNSIVPLLEFWQKKYDKSLSETEKSGRSYVGNYIKNLENLADILDSHVQNNPVAAKEVLQSIDLIAQKGYPHLYIDADFNKSPDYFMAHDNGVANCDSEINLSLTLRYTIEDVINADPSLLNDACTVVQNVKDCSEKVYFDGTNYEPSVFENAQKRNFLRWMKNKSTSNEKNLSKNELIYEKNGFFSHYTGLKYNEGKLVCHYYTQRADSAEGYIDVPHTKSYYLSEQDQILVENIIKTKNPKLLKKLAKIVKNNSSEMKGLTESYLKYQRNTENKKNAVNGPQVPSKDKLKEYPSGSSWVAHLANQSKLLFNKLLGRDGRK